MNEFDTDVPLPEPGIQRGASKYRLEKMQPGDSLFIPGKTSGYLSAHIWHAKKRMPPGAQFTSRTRDENFVNGVRVWRIE